MMSGGQYFVFGLPRSRTAWLSVFLSQSGIHCHHEAVNGCYTKNEYLAKIDGCGDSTTAFGLCQEAQYKDKPVLIIEKSKAELSRCIEWCNGVFGSGSKDAIMSQHDKLMELEGMKVAQPQINKKMPAIFEYLTSHKWVDSYGDMASINIQSQVSSINYDAMRAYIND